MDMPIHAHETIVYSLERRVTVTAFKDILERSGLSKRRPVNDLRRLERMLAAYNLILTAWERDTPVGIATLWTDHAFVAYLADLAVDRRLQKQGIGRRLVALAKEAVGPQVTLMLLAAPAAADYYSKIGMKRFADCFLLPRSQ